MKINNKLSNKLHKPLTVLALAAVFVLVLVSLSVTVNLTSAASTVTLTQSGRTETTITLSWTESSDSIFFSSYELYYSTQGVNGPWSSSPLWSTSNIDQTSCSITNLLPNTNYWFYIVDNDWVTNERSNTYQASTSSPPQLTRTSQTTTAASISWTDYNTYTSSMPFKSYTIQMSASGQNGPWSTLTTITNQTQSTYLITGLNPGIYYVRMYDTVGIGTTTNSTYSSFSNVITIDIVAVTLSPSSATTTVKGQPVQFTTTPNGGTGSFSYQWQVNGISIAGATSATYTHNPPSNPVPSPTMYSINVILTDSLGSSAQATPAQVTVLNIPVTVSINPSTTTSTCIGLPVQFSASVTGGTGSYQYQWYSNGVAIAGATLQTYAFTPTQQGNYDITVTAKDNQDSTLATATSPATTVKAYPLVTVAISSPSTQAITNQQIQLSSSASGGTGSYQYQWYVNDSPITGATSSTFSFSQSNSGTYTVHIACQDSALTNAKATSNRISITVPAPTPVPTPTPPLTQSPTTTPTTLPTAELLTSPESTPTSNPAAASTATPTATPTVTPSPSPTIVDVNSFPITYIAAIIIAILLAAAVALTVLNKHKKSA